MILSKYPISIYTYPLVFDGVTFLRVMLDWLFFPESLVLISVSLSKCLIPPPLLLRIYGRFRPCFVMNNETWIYFLYNWLPSSLSIITFFCKETVNKSRFSRPLGILFCVIFLLDHFIGLNYELHNIHRFVTYLILIVDKTGNVL